MINRIVYTSFLLGASFASTDAQVNTPPNIVLILCDDMGFSDLGCYGSEIQTPNRKRGTLQPVQKYRKKLPQPCCFADRALSARSRHGMDDGSR